MKADSPVPLLRRERQRIFACTVATVTSAAPSRTDARGCPSIGSASVTAAGSPSGATRPHDARTHTPRTDRVSQWPLPSPCVTFCQLSARAVSVCLSRRSPMRQSRLLNLAKRTRYWTYILVCHSATIRTWPITRNGDGNGSIL
jgi:hypothetical protein